MDAYGDARGQGMAAAHGRGGVDLPVSSGVGVTTLFSVLLILCVTVFAVLAFASAQADLRLTKKNAEMVSAYYAADASAARLSAKVQEFWPKGAPLPDAASLEALEAALLDEGQGVVSAEAKYDAGGIRVSYSIGAGAMLTLDVALFLPEGGACEALSWRTQAKEATPEEEGLPVWQG